MLKLALAAHALRSAALAAMAIALAAAGIAASDATAAPTFSASSVSGDVVFFQSDKRVLPADTDSQRDIYARSFSADVGGLVTRQVSIGPAGGNDAFPVNFEGASVDGRYVFFSTREQLTEDDRDRRDDVYVRDLHTSTTLLVSTGSTWCAPDCGNGPHDAGFAGASADGSKAFFVTEERLAPGDLDDAVDLYARDLSSGETVLASPGADECAPQCGNGPVHIIHRGVSADGSAAFFTTEERLAEEDEDEATDIYARLLPTGRTVLVSDPEAGCDGCGGGASPVFRAAGDDGGRVFFTTEERLVEEDEDGATDVYARDLPDGPTRLVSAGESGSLGASFVAASSSGHRALFSTAAALDPADTNGRDDLYLWSGGGAPELVTPGNCAAGAKCDTTFGALTPDGSKVFYDTADPLAPGDDDEALDAYAQSVPGGSPMLASAPADDCPPGCPGASRPSAFKAASTDGGTVLFATDGALSAADDSGVLDEDVYARRSGETLLVTPSGFCPKKRCDATFVGATPDASRVYFITEERLTPEDGDEDGEPADIWEQRMPSEGEAPEPRLISTGNTPKVEEALAPAAPTLTGTDPPSPGDATEIRVRGTAPENASIKVYATADCSQAVVGLGSAEQLAGPGILVTVEPGSTVSLRATAEVDGFVSECSAPVAYRHLLIEAPKPGGSGAGAPSKGDGGPTSSAPAPPRSLARARAAITFGPAGKTRQRRLLLRFVEAGGLPSATFKCKLDRERWRRCRSPLKLRRLAFGRHVFRVIAEAPGASGPSAPATVKFRVVRR